MNFLAHLHLAERAALPLAGAILGDYFRGALPASLPSALARSVQLHRRIDATTDRHPVVAAARAGFPQGARRYAGILLDILFDHALALDWARYSAEPLERFAPRAAVEVATEPQWFELAGGTVPPPESFGRLLLSYRSAEGIEQAVLRTSRRLRQPEGLVNALAGWRDRMPEVRAGLPRLLEDLGSGR